MIPENVKRSDNKAINWKKVFLIKYIDQKLHCYDYASLSVPLIFNKDAFSGQ